MKVLFLTKNKTLVVDKFKGMLIEDLVRYALKDRMQHTSPVHHTAILYVSWEYEIVPAIHSNWELFHE